MVIIYNQKCLVFCGSVVSIFLIDAMGWSGEKLSLVRFCSPKTIIVRSMKNYKYNCVDHVTSIIKERIMAKETEDDHRYNRYLPRTLLYF